MSALHTRFNIIVPVLAETLVDNRKAYKIQMPSGLIALVWADDLMFIQVPVPAGWFPYPTSVRWYGAGAKIKGVIMVDNFMTEEIRIPRKICKYCKMLIDDCICELIDNEDNL